MSSALYAERRPCSPGFMSDAHVTHSVPALEPRPDVGPEYCDIVMKGGITSGVVYPPAVCELAKRFRFRNVGGTSEGAIAAAAAAAAEYGRDVPDAGFQQLARLPEWLGAKGNLLGLFQPQRETAPLFHVALAGVGNAPLWRRVLHVGLASITRFAPWTLLGAAPGLWLLWASWTWFPSGGVRMLATLLAILFTVAGALLLTSTGLVRQLAHALPANAYGLCRGYDATEHPTRPGLTQWLDAELDRLAGRVGAAWPLTFRHLWVGREAGMRFDTAAPSESTPDGVTGTEGGTRAAASVSEPDQRQVNLQMVTTNLTHGRPYGLPFEYAALLFRRRRIATLLP